MTGHITKRGEKYVIIVYLGIGLDGKKKQKWYSGYNSKEEAKEDFPNVLLDAKKYAVGTIGSGDITLDSLHQFWYDQYALKNLSESTNEVNEYIYSKHFKPIWGKKDIKRITSTDVQTFIDTLKN